MTTAEILEVTEKNVKEQRIVIDAVKHWLNNYANWLLVLDNVEDFEMISNFVPSEHKGHILLTTQMQATSGLAQRVIIEPMEPNEGALLLLRRANLITQNALLDEVSDADLTQAEEISRFLGGLPLGLDQAGAYIEETGNSLSGYLELYQTRQRELMQRRGKPTTGHPEPVITTWTLSFAKLEQVNADAGRTVTLLCFSRS